MPEQITQKIAQECPGRGRQPDRGQFHDAEANQCADAEQDHYAGQQDANQDQGFEQGDQEHDRKAPARVGIEPSKQFLCPACIQCKFLWVTSRVQSGRRQAVIIRD